MSIDLLERLTRLMKDNDLNTVDVRDGDKRVILKRGATVVPSQGMTIQSPIATANTHALPPMSPATAGDSAPGMLQIKSPMVGTFYSAASPEAKPFVSVGSTVDEETDVCIIEAMKVFNEIPAEVRGKIVAVLCEDGEAVEFDKPLFKVDTSG